ncbi:NUDIX domain-containing protein [Octadecabacter sp. G9-8]|uniref:NUDIX domain-containing protein n=1 Tax=Octadecabacter dasysiphoniae TaxID=2909341 RepID=A0ABS9CU15_9RHOB|nr:NUDIX domain-containing protein [Octadecabacter dasysiphoniae]MCF2870730.1 NUDIX domain-containing protein [Octadecabacter dasysiphoniae]
MENLTTHWRPIGKIANKALAIVRRAGPLGDEILACAIPDDTGAIKGWRPLGGSIEFGEQAAETVLRELGEEIFATARIIKQIDVVENIYDHHGIRGHEVVFLFDVELIDPGLAKDDQFVLIEDNGSRNLAGWVPLSDFEAGTTRLFPDGLLSRLSPPNPCA